MTNEDRGLVLNGLDGSNPLGFLSAVGTLRTATLAEPHYEWQMKWVVHAGCWSPELATDRHTTREELIEMLAAALNRPTPEFDFAKNLAVDPEEFRGIAQKAQCCASPQGRGFADFIAAFGSDAVTKGDGKTIQDTALRTMGGAGNQHFLGTMKHLVEKTVACDLRRSLYEPWTYPDRKLGLRWDPQEDRRYALRWANPSGGDGVPTVRGANRLAVEAIPLLPTTPAGKHLQTTGFTRDDRKDWFTWPIWDCAIGVDVVRSLLALAGIQVAEPDRRQLRTVGVVEVFRSRRTTVGQYRNFSPARPA